MDFNWTSVVLMLFGTVFGFIGYQYKEIHGRLKEDIEKNKQAVVKLEDRIVDMQTKFPKEYASRDDDLRSVANLDTKVDRISNELILINKNIGRLAGGEV